MTTKRHKSDAKVHNMIPNMPSNHKSTTKAHILTTNPNKSGRKTHKWTTKRHKSTTRTQNLTTKIHKANQRVTSNDSGIPVNSKRPRLTTNQPQRDTQRPPRITTGSQINDKEAQNDD